MTVRVCLFGTFDPDDARNRVLLAALRSQGADVLMCNVSAWPATRDRVAAARFSGRTVRLLARMARAHWALWRQHRALDHYDAMLVLHPGFLDMPLARLLSFSRRAPLALDAYLTLYETAIEDRRLVSPRGVVAGMLRAVDLLAAWLADRLLVDTRANGDMLVKRLGIAPHRVSVVPVGADESIYRPSPVPEADDALRVLFFGNFIPLHGVEHIIGAAHILRDRPDIQWTLIGDGQTYEEMRALHERLGPSQLTWGPRWLPPVELATEIARAHVCLGVFGASGKASRVIPTKAYIALCMGRGLVTMDSPAARAYLCDGRDALLCQASARSLAECVARLRADPTLLRGISTGGRALFVREFSTQRIGEMLVAALLRQT